MNIEEAKEISAAGWPDSQIMQRKFDAAQWLISEVERLEKMTTETTDKPLAGMYAVNDPRYPQVKVGNFIICRQNNDGVWMQREDTDEGGEFCDSVFEPALAEFWKENF